MSSKNRVKTKTLIIVFDNLHENLIMIKEKCGKDHWEGSLNAIGGHIEQGEDIYFSAQRECKEELGIDQDLSLEWIGCMHVQDKKGEGNMMFLFSTEISKHIPLKGSSEGEIKWINVKDIIDNKNIVEDIRLFVRFIISKKPGTYFTGTTKYKSDGTITQISINNHKFF